MLHQFYIIEIKQYPNGEYEHNVQWAYDEDQDTAQRKAEAKAYELLQAAALSETATHSVTVLSDEGFRVMGKCYHNIVNTRREVRFDEE